MKNYKCGVCGKRGSLHLKEVWNQQGTKYHYYYVAHSRVIRHKKRVIWHYRGKSPKGIKKKARRR